MNINGYSRRYLRYLLYLLKVYVILIKGFLAEYKLFSYRFEEYLNIQYSY